MSSGAASIGKGLGRMLFSRFGRSSTQAAEPGKDGVEGDDKKTTVGTPPFSQSSSSSAFLEPTCQ